MSSRAWTWRHAILKSNLAPTTRHVLMTISCHMNDLGEGCYPSTATLAVETGLTERSVCTHIAMARQAGWLTVEQHGFKGRSWARNEYKAAWPDDENGTETLSVPPSEGTEPDDREALNELQSNISRNIPESPLPPVEDGGRERGDTTSISVDEKARPKAAEIVAELRQTCPHVDIVETLFVPMLAERKFVAPMPAYALKQRADWIAKKPAMDADGLQLALRKLLDGRRMSIEPSHIEDAVRAAENEISTRRVAAVQRGERVTVRRGEPGWQLWLDHLRAAGRFAAADLAERWGHLDATSTDPEGAKLLLPTPTMERLHERQQAGYAA